MLFNKRFDLPLLLMMTEDKKNRNVIAKFINIIPDEFYIYLRSEISKYLTCSVVSLNETHYFQTQNFFLNDGFMYTVNSRIVFGKLEIKLHRRDFDDMVEENYSLSLLSLDRDNLSDQLRTDVELGKFSYDLVEYERNNVNSKKVSVKNSYMVKLNKCGNLYVYSKNNILKLGVEVDLSNISDDMDIVGFNNGEMIDKIVRKRVK